MLPNKDKAGYVIMMLPTAYSYARLGFGASSQEVVPGVDRLREID
jgi:hypothetical protein